MTNNAVNESITETIDQDEDDIKQVNSFGDALKEMGNTVFVRYPAKTSNLSSENANGITRAEVLNEYMYRNFGFQYESLNTLAKQKRVNVVSVKGYGLTTFVEAIKSISASFEQTQVPEGIRSLLNRR